MKKFNAWIIGTAFLMMSGSVHADGPTYSTTFRLSSENLTTNMVTTYPTNRDVELVMPIGSPWQCRTNKAVVNDHNLFIVGFLCATSEGSVSIDALCNAVTEDLTFSSGLIMSRGTTATVRLQASCITTRNK